MKKKIEMFGLYLIFFAPIIFPIFMAILYWGFGVR